MSELEVLTGEIVGTHTADEWAGIVRADLGRAAEGFISAGLHLRQAKAEISRGDWLPWIERELPFGKDKVEWLMKIAANEALTNSVYVQNLPPSYATLYELSRLEPPLLRAAIEAGDVHPDLERKRAAALVVEYRKAAAVEAAKSVQRGQWWQLGEHLLYCGDSADDAFTSRATAAAFAFADPPYNAGKADWDQDFKWRHDYLAEAAEIIAVTPGISAIPWFLRTTEMPYRWSMAAWITNGMTRGALGFGNWIYIALFSHAESLHRDAQDHLRIAVSPASVSTRHESRKPAELLVSLLGIFTAEGDTVIDPFLGSGTTLFAAEQTGRRCIGAEIEPEFCAEIITRYGEDARPL